MRFFLSSQSNPINARHDLWSRRLPTSREGNPQTDDDVSEKSLTYGEYFSAVERFIDSFPEHFGNASISVFLEKHGAFYHPSRIAVRRGGQVDEYVINVAFSAAGRQYLHNEYNTLKMLKDKYAYLFLPKVFACREIPVDPAKTISMFAGEWFTSFHEFHVSAVKQKDTGNVRVWDPATTACFLSKDQAYHVYAQAAMVLTACYDIQTFEHISSWHHAAGDFVVNLQNPRAPRVKLITVRRYAPLLEAMEETTEAILNGLLLFLLNLSLRMRLDRRDGVKEVCWMDDYVVGATVKGFFQGLALQHKNHRIPDGFVEGYKSFLTEIGLQTLQELFKELARQFTRGAADTPVVRAHIHEHAHAFYRCLQSPL